MRSERVRLDISIHALVKRATFVLSGQYFRIMDFNPRPREEGDLNYNDRRLQIQYFNPRPREEGDSFKSGATENRRISIHALVKRATYCVLSFDATEDISIHALVKRATLE